MSVRGQKPRTIRLTWTYVLEEEVSHTVLEHHLDEVDCALSGVHNRRALSRACEQRVRANIIGTDPQGDYCLVGVEAQGAVTFLLQE